ncbi:MAG: HD domain-containing protein [Clostridium sp.]|uniref:HD domain-containing protein n=1 Tax=Clostridium sp. TaxID=1506 RepID=UPI0039EB2878
MDRELIIERTKEFVKSKLYGEETGHDWWHTYRVWRNAIKIGEKEQADMLIVELSALLHDVADYKFYNGDTDISSKVVNEWLESINVQKEVISKVCDVIENISFKGANVKSQISTKECMVVQDADRLDAIGAIGISRVFAFGGAVKREIYNPDISVQKHDTFEQYKNSIHTSTSINHFYEKLLLIKNLMNTDMGKSLAQDRHRYMEEYLNKFMNEWEGIE